MAKTHKTITLDEDVASDIQANVARHRLNFSEWVNNMYRDQFMSKQSKEQKIKEHEAAITTLKAEIQESEQRKETYRQLFSRDEERFLRQVPSLIREGKQWPNLCTRFNLDFKSDLNLSEFQAAVRRLSN